MNPDKEPEAPLFDPTLQKQAHGEAGRKPYKHGHDPEHEGHSEAEERGRRDSGGTPKR